MHMVDILVRASKVCLLVSVAVVALSAQEIVQREINDSLGLRHPVNQSLLHSFETGFMFPKSIGESPEYIPQSLHQALTLSPVSLSGQFQQQIDLVSPWKQELAKQNEYRTLKLVLGSIQAGGTAYLLYEHNKKYGLK
jgi:hypothetical protein